MLVFPLQVTDLSRVLSIKLKDNEISLLCKLLDTELSKWTKQEIITIIALSGSPLAVEKLNKLLTSDDIEMKLAALEGSSILGREEILTDLLKLMDDKNEQTAASAIKAPGHFKNKEQIVDILINKLVTTKSNEIVESFIDALAKTANKKAVPVIIDILHLTDCTLRSNRDVISAAIMALEELGDRRAIEALEDLQYNRTDDPGLQLKAQDARLKIIQG